MSFHNKPDYHIPELIEALKAHRLPHDTPSQLADSFRIGWMACCRELAQATAAQAVVQDDPITIRKPTTSAELLWLLKLAHLVISDVDKTLEEAFAPAQPAAQQGVTYAERPEPLSKRPSEANTLVWVADPISSTGVRGVFVDDITCLWWWGAGLIFQKEADAAALALRMRSQVYNVFL